MTPSSTPSPVKQITAQELKSMLDRQVPLALYDVRTEGERAIATIPGARHLDQAAAADLADPETDRGALIVFHCHHGIRSQSAAMHFAALGFTNLCNLVGGIEAWSTAVDPAVPRY
jgi:monothiol glutaredoxin